MGGFTIVISFGSDYIESEHIEESKLVQFKKPAGKPKTGKGKVLGMCEHGFHRWKICKDKQFDSREGKLVTIYRCERCGKQKVMAH